MNETNGARSLLETAAQAGVRVCFANPGTTEMPLVAALDAVPVIRAILCLFEGVCTGAADGYGRMRRAPALTLLHLGPGFGNGLANLHNARRAFTPIVNLVGDQASWHLAHDAPLTSDIASLAGTVSGWVRTATSSQEMAEGIAQAIRAAIGPPGQVATYILPADYQADDTLTEAAPTETAAGGAATPLATAVDAEQIEIAARRLGAAGERGFLLLGGRALGAAGQLAAARIAAACGARVQIETFPARWERGAGLPAFDRLPYFPEQARAELAGAEVVVLAGAKAPVAFFGYPDQPSQLAPDGACLILAGPAEDADGALDALARQLALPGQPPPDVTSDMPSTAAAGAALDAALDAASLGAALAACLPEQAIVVEEAATSSLPFYAASTDSPRHTVLTLTGGAIGQGPPVATGAAIACPERRVISFQADGSAAYTLQALWTQVREGLDVLTVLCSNRAYRILQVELSRSGIREPGPQARSLTQLEEPALDWVSLARGFGMPATRVESADELRLALSRALADSGPQLIEVVLP
jgi:acetolactate synthase-1/2/3 large subunit